MALLPRPPLGGNCSPAFLNTNPVLGGLVPAASKSILRTS